MKKIFKNPSKKNLHLIGRELLNIKINHSSFSVFSQLSSIISAKETLDVDEFIFPLCALHQFFKINSNPKINLVHRPSACHWAPNFDKQKWMKPTSTN